MPDEHSVEEHEKMLLELDEERAKAAKDLEVTYEKLEKFTDEVTELITKVVDVQMESRARC